MINIFEYLNYRHWIADKIRETKELRPGWTLSKIAEKISVQAPYLSNVIKEKSHLNADQVYRLAEVFNLNNYEQSYFLLLLEWDRSQLQTRKQSLKDQIDSIRKKELQTENYIKSPKIQKMTPELSEFFLNPQLQVIYFLTGIDKYCNDSEKMAKTLKVDTPKVNELLDKLLELGFINKESGRITRSKKSYHLPKDSPLREPHQKLMTYAGIQHKQLLPDHLKYQFSVLFTSDPETHEKIRQEFLNFISKMEEWVKESPAEEVYQLHIDLFPWSGL